MFKIQFTSNGRKYKFESDKALSLYTQILDWLSESGYDFSGQIHNSFVRKTFTEMELKKFISDSTFYKKSHFYKIKNSNKYIQICKGNLGSRLLNIILMLENFGVDRSTITSVGFEGETETSDDTFVNSAIGSKNSIKNPFKQSICIIGKSGAGKSVTIRNILEKENHQFEFMIPSALSGNLLYQYYPSKSEYRLSKLGKMIVDAANDPDNLYTMVIDEMHKSHVIEMINDELLQAISTDRNKYRFVSLDSDTTALFKDSMSPEFFKAGNIVIPDNFGILFISSKEDVIINNDDFFNRVSIVILTEDDRDMQTKEDLLSKVLSPEEKRSLRKY